MFFMNYLHSQPGLDKSFFTAWQHNPGNGIDGLNAAPPPLAAAAISSPLLRTSSALVDGFIDNGAAVTGLTGQFSNGATEATVNIDAQANSTPGAHPGRPLH